MRVEKFEIRSPWKNLGGLVIDLDKSRDVTVIIGRNGSAKSNLLEALITIFRNIDLQYHAPFSYFISYELYGSRVVIEAEVDKTPKALLDGKIFQCKDYAMIGPRGML